MAHGGLSCQFYTPDILFIALWKPALACIAALPTWETCCLLQKNAVAVAYCKRGKGEMRLNGECRQCWTMQLDSEKGQPSSSS
jgi:hypothetical protein